MGNENNGIGRIKSQIIGEIGKFRISRPDLTVLPSWDDRETLEAEIEALARIVKSEEVISLEKEVLLGNKWLSGAKSILNMVAEGILDEDEASSFIQEKLHPIAEILGKRGLEAIKLLPKMEIDTYKIRIQQGRRLRRLINFVSRIGAIPQLATHQEMYESIAKTLERVNDVLSVATEIWKEGSLLTEEQFKDKEDALADKAYPLVNKAETKLHELNLQISKVLPYLPERERNLCRWLSKYLDEFEDSGIEVDETDESYNFVNFIKKKVLDEHLCSSSKK